MEGFENRYVMSKVYMIRGENGRMLGWQTCACASPLLGRQIVPQKGGCGSTSCVSACLANNVVKLNQLIGRHQCRQCAARQYRSNIPINWQRGKRRWLLSSVLKRTAIFQSGKACLRKLVTSAM